MKIGISTENKERILAAINDIASQSAINPLTGDLMLKDYSAMFEITYFDGYLLISSVSSMEPGSGTKVMSLICNTADKYGVKCRLSAKPFGTKENKMNKTQLIHWYKKFGFKSNPNHWDKGDMERLPKNSLNESINKPIFSFNIDKKYLNDNNYILYHGTNSKNAKNILQTGLNSIHNFNDANWFMLSTNLKTAKEFSSDGVVLKISIPEEQITEYLWPGYRSKAYNDIQYALRKTIPAKYISKINSRLSIKEFTKKDLNPINSFKLHSKLNQKIWNKQDDIREDIRNALLRTAEDYIEGIGLEIKIKDIILTGSLANYNYSKYSDFDLHILVDFYEINKDVVLVKKFFDADRKNWNDSHDIFIKGYEVEIYVQDINESHTSSGMFSLLNDEWIKKPSLKTFKIDTNLIEQKAKDYMNSIDDLEKTKDYDKAVKLLSKISKGRKEGIATKDAELSIENLVFKTLRRNNYIKKLIGLRNKAYDKKYENLVESLNTKEELEAFRLEFLNEAKQLGSLYHFTNFRSLKNIIEENFLQSFGFKSDKKNIRYRGISTTRDKDFNRKNRKGIGGLSVRIELDGNNISNNYKIMTYNFWYQEAGREGARPIAKGFQQDTESEEVILAKNGLRNAIKYIKSIVFYPQFENDYYSAVAELPKMIELIKNKNIPFNIVPEETVLQWKKRIGLTETIVENILLEARQRGILYHFTSFENLISIIEANTLKSGYFYETNFYNKKEFFGVSLTRDANFQKTGDRINEGIKGVSARIELDGNKISENYKILPYNYFTHKKVARPKETESEEVILTKSKEGITNLKKYIKLVTLIPEIADLKDEKFIIEAIETLKKHKIEYYLNDIWEDNISELGGMTEQAADVNE